MYLKVNTSVCIVTDLFNLIEVFYYAKKNRIKVNLCSEMRTCNVYVIVNVNTITAINLLL